MKEVGSSKRSEIVINLLFLNDSYNQINNAPTSCTNKTVLVWVRLYKKLASWVRDASESIQSESRQSRQETKERYRTNGLQEEMGGRERIERMMERRMREETDYRGEHIEIHLRRRKDYNNMRGRDEGLGGIYTVEYIYTVYISHSWEFLPRAMFFVLKQIGC